MKTLASSSCIAIIASLFIFLSGCGSGKPELVKVDPAFNEYISAYSSGMRSRKNNIRIELQDVLTNEVMESISNNGLGLPDSALLKDVFTFEPEIKGHAIWTDGHSIEFVPDEPLPVNQFYDVYFDLDRLTQVKDGYEEFHFQFATYQQELTVSTDGLFSQDDYNSQWKSLRGDLRTHDFEDTAMLRKTLQIIQNGKELPFTLETSYEDNMYYFQVDSIQRGKDEGKVIVTWNGAPINAMNLGKKEIIVPALGDYTAISAKVVDEGDQYVEVDFSEPILASQDLNGIITIDGIDNLTFNVTGTLVTVYLPNRFVGEHTLRISDGLRNVMGYQMKKPYSTELVFNEPSPMVRIKGNGSILPNSQGLIFPFEAVSLKAVDVRIIKIYENNIHHFLQINDLDGDDGLTRFGKVIAEKKISLDYDKSMNLKQWNTHVIDLNKFIKADPGSIYRVSIKFQKEYAVCDCPVEETDESEEASTEYEEGNDPSWSEENWHGYGFDDGYDNWYYYSDNSSPCSDDYYEGRAVSRNILASDLGTVFKLDEDHLSHTFVSDMLTTAPVSGAQVTFYDFTKQVIAQGTTDGNGMLEIRLKEKPFLMITKRGDQRGYMKLGDGYSNSLSEFDIEGEELQNGVKGFIYGERGVWRPGDSLYLTFVLQDLLKKLPPNHPVGFQLQDPNGQVVDEQTCVKHVNGMYDFRTATATEAPTGNYTAIVTVGNRTYTKNLRVETIKPNRLKILMNVDGDLAKDSTKLAVKWLHGAIAKKLRATVSVKVSQLETAFDNYKGYTFDSPVRTCHTDMELIYDSFLDDKGEAWVKTKLDVGTTAPGMLRAHYITKVYEAGGDFSIDRSSVNYSPFETYIGLRKPANAHMDGSLETDQRHTFDLVALTEDGKPSKADKIQVKIYKLEWRWWYEKDDEKLSDYMARTGTIVIKDTVVSAKNGKANFHFKVQSPDYGRYLITATDLEGQHQTGEIITIDYPYRSRGNHRDNERANMLSFACDKENYTKGEQIKVSIPSPSNGRALISVETSRKVVKKFWINTVKGETVHSFEATADMSPNAFIHVTLIQPHASTQNDLPIRMYGIVPVMVDDQNTHLHPEIVMADQVRPETKTSIKIKEQNGRKMTYTLAIVDEGLLDLTAFKTPQPWTTFYAKEALGVRTWDIYDHVIGAYAGKIDKLLSIGGDGDLDGSKGPKANRFKPVVTHLGPFVVEAGQTGNHTIDIPNYVGSVRVMVVAQQDGAYGNTEKAVAVKKPLMVLSTLPRVLGPGESVQLPVTVFAMEKHIKDVKVTVEVNDLVSLEGPKTQSISFTEPGDNMLHFKLQVAEKVGIAKVKITATCGSEKAVEEIELDVRPANPIVFEGQETILQPGKSWDTEIQFKGLSGTNQATVELSSIPSIGLEKRLKYLIEYPHGCIEQTTSAVFPQLYVDNLMELTEDQKTRTSANVTAGLKRLQFFQTSNGGFAYWPGESSENEWGTNYAGHFMLEAEQQGYHLPGNMKNRWLEYQQQAARDFDPSNNSYGSNSDMLTQAYRLFVLALGKKQELGAMNRLRETKNLSVAAKWRLAAAYQLVGQQEVAKQLIDPLPLTVSNYRELSDSYGSEIRDQAMILEVLSLSNRTTKASSVAEKVAQKLNSDTWMSTQETAYSLLAICEYTGVKNGSGINCSYQLNGGTAQKITSGKTVTPIQYREKDFAKHANFRCKNTGKWPLYVKVMVQGVPLKGDSKAASNSLKLSLKFRDGDGKEIKPDKLAQGTDFTSEVTITNTGKKGTYREMALTQIFPSGWEIHNSRMDDGGIFSVARYLDIRDDRVYSYYDLEQNESKTFTIRLNATYLGRFYLPTTYSDAMYNHLINASAPGKWVEVVKQT
jgi:alpha-2-macroglobulin